MFLHKNINCINSERLNPFHATGLFLYLYEYQKTRGELTKEIGQQRHYGRHELAISIVWKLEILLKVAFRKFLKININSELAMHN